MRKILVASLFVLFLTLIVLILYANKSKVINAPKQIIPVQNQSIPNITIAKVTRIIDGDTIEIETGQKVRLIGIDTPEIVDPRKTVECFGKEASAKTEELLLNSTVALEKDISETDKYGRLLRYAYKGDILINELLVAQGFAHAVSFPPDIKYQEKLRKAQDEARKNNLGLWSACKS